ncbi:hypothetical protein LUZ62_028380 [Rhynchospora pubera]|uniref:Acetylornithine transaminase n=1 Tax=Rhynchospora pubera TaxID=906938 RepID=A0AAV8HGP3_9POAL|nr:hypothetical protein LUZ62_043247 [Rhynchospora pubera]KAJ4815814.1 hypothetical protein LUZ62_028380 [Rhynchospora pubera]
MAYLQSLNTTHSALSIQSKNYKTLSFKPHTAKISSCLVSDVTTKPITTANSTSVSHMSKELMEADKSVMVGTYARTPVVLEKGIGSKVYDVDGKEYLDMAAGIAVNSLGHADPDWLKAVTDQASILAHVSNVFYSVPQVKLAQRLIECSFADRVFFSNSGTEANEAAIKFSRKYQRHTHPDSTDPPTEFIAFSNSFHGRTLGSLALTSKEQYRSPFEPIMPGVTFVDYGDVAEVARLVKKGNVAAVFVEPLQGEGGIHSATKEFLLGLRSVCDEAGALLVFDEVQCGLGRTGHLWTHEAYGIYPDIMTLAKPLAGGLPIGVVLATQEVASAIKPGDHGSTFAGSPLVCHAALTVLNKINTPSFLSDVTKKGNYLKELLAKKLKGNTHVTEIRGMGLIVGIELDMPASGLVDECRENGVLVLTAGKGNVVRLVPPLVISMEELEFGAEIISKCLAAL